MILLVFQVVAFVLADGLIYVQDTFAVLIALHFGSVLPVTPNHDSSSIQLLKSFFGKYSEILNAHKTAFIKVDDM